MDAVYLYEGWLLDLVSHFMERIVKNIFPSEADEKSIAVYEKLLQIESEPGLTLEERRRAVLAYYSGTGKLSLRAIQSIVMEYTGYACEVWWEGSALQIRILCDDGRVSPQKVYDVVSRRMPAHLGCGVSMLEAVETCACAEYCICASGHEVVSVSVDG